MTTTDHSTDDAFEVEHYTYICEQRDKLCAELAQLLTTGMAASATLRELQSNSVYDVELAEGSAGQDVKEFLLDAMRYTRAAYTIVHDLIERDR